MFYIASYLQQVEDCYEAVDSFVKNDPSTLSDIDLDLARVKLLPYYLKNCPLFLELDDYDYSLEREKRIRQRVDL